MKVIDISWPISSATTGYKDKKVVAFEDVKTFAKDGSRETNVCLSSHTGTHVDAPSHFLKDGKTIDEIDLHRCIGPAKVLDLTTVQERITGDALKDFNIKKDDIILLKTTNSDVKATDPFNHHFVYLDPTGARYLSDKKVKAVGIDYLGIERGNPEHAAHTTLMKADIVIIEGLRLRAVEPGEYLFVCLPLYSIGVEAAPARAVLICD